MNNKNNITTTLEVIILMVAIMVSSYIEYEMVLGEEEWWYDGVCTIAIIAGIIVFFRWLGR